MLLQRLKYAHKIAGLSGVAMALGYALFNKFFYLKILRGMTLLTADVSEAFLSVPHPYETRLLCAEDMRRWAGQNEYDLDADFLDLAQSKGDQCLAIFHKKQLAAYGWYSHQPTRFSQRYHLTFDPQWVYMYRGFTHPDFRGQRLHAHGMTEAARVFTAAGYRGLISYVEANNFASLRSCERLGYKTFGSIYVMAIGDHSRVYRTASCQDYQFDLQPLKNPDGSAVTSTTLVA